MRYTIMDIAREAGVSIKTVSRVINDSPNVSEKTRKLVLDVIKRLNYCPNANARGLITNKTNTIGVFIDYESKYVFSNLLFAEVLRGITEVCNQVEYHLLLQCKWENSFINLVRSNKIDGLIYLCVRHDSKFTDELIKANFPFVLIGKPAKDERINWVEVDDERGGYLATRHLLELGHTKIAFLGGSKNYMSYVKRFNGFIRALKERNIEPRPDWIVNNSYFGQEEGYQAMKVLLTALERPTAVFVFNDLLAMGALRALLEKGIKVPEEMSIVGYDNIMPCAYTNPPLTTVEQPAFEKGAIAARLLIKLINEEPFEKRPILLPPKLIIRKSTCACCCKKNERLPKIVSSY